MRVSSLKDAEERHEHVDPDAAAAGLAAGRRIFLATVHGDVQPPGATGTAYRLFPGTGDAPRTLTRVTAGDLLADLA